MQGTRGMQKVTVPPGADWVRLQLDLGTGDYKRYQAVLQKDGKEIWSQITPRIKTEDAIEALIVPAKILPHGDYILKLSGIPASGEPRRYSKLHFFRVLPK